MPEVSFVIPAYNEQDLIARTIGSIRDAVEPGAVTYEVIVADDASGDATGEIACSLGATVVREHHRQIAATRNAGARAASGDLLIFVDADTLVTPGAVAGALEAWRSGAVYGGARVEFDGRVPLWSRAMLGVMMPLYAMAKLAPGCFLFCTRDAFEAVGGFDETMYAAEEADIARRLRRRGRHTLLRARVRTSGRKLRAYSGREILGECVRLAFGGRRRISSREGLDIWYGPRRRDPTPEPAARPGDARG